MSTVYNVIERTRENRETDGANLKTVITAVPVIQSRPSTDITLYFHPLLSLEVVLGMTALLRAFGQINNIPLHYLFALKF